MWVRKMIFFGNGKKEDFTGVDGVEGSYISRVAYNDVTYWTAID